MMKKDHLTAVLFLACLGLFCGMFLLTFLPKYQYTEMARPEVLEAKALPDREEVERVLPELLYGRASETKAAPLIDTARAAIAAAEPAMNSRLDESHFFIQLYGAAQSLSGRRVVEDTAQPEYSVVELDDGSLSFTNDSPYRGTDYAVHNVVRLEGALADRGIGLLYVQAPQKVRSDDQLPYGVEDTNNQAVDELLVGLEEAGIETLDLREELAREAEELGMEWTDWFFVTDHHWTPEAAFHANQYLLDYLEERHTVARRSPGGGVKQLPYEIPEKYRSEDYFTKTTYEDYFLGSQGKRTGTLYAGVDDIEMWAPNYPTYFRYLASYGDDRTGSFADSLLFSQRVEEVDWFNGNPYTLYSGGDYPIAHITNYYNNTGPKVMLIRDSFSCTLAPFLALSCSALYTIDLRYFTGDLLAYVDWLDPDYVFILYAPGTARSNAMFDFFAAAAGEGGKTLPEALALSGYKAIPAGTEDVDALVPDGPVKHPVGSGTDSEAENFDELSVNTLAKLDRLD